MGRRIKEGLEGRRRRKKGNKKKKRQEIKEEQQKMELQRVKKRNLREKT